MSDTRSRSEIETALSGKQKLYKRKISSSKNKGESVDLTLDSNSPRRQQVIGGDLTGVSRRRHRNGLLSKFSDINLTNWLAGIVVASILVAFFWPHKNSPSIREVTEQNLTPNTESFYTESRIDTLEETAPNSTSFSRTSDLDRANQYRVEEETKQQIEELLITAKQQIAKGQYTQPKDSNALASYRTILAIDQSNIDARDGINDLKRRFLAFGRNALTEGNEKDAISSLKLIESVDSTSSEYKLLTQDIKQWRKEAQIKNLLSKADAAKRSDKLILPADQSSLYFYRQVIAIDSKNINALDGIKSITGIYIDRANTSLIDGDLDKATAYLASASIVNPNDPSIEVLSNMISTAEPIAALTQENRQQNTNDDESQQSNSTPQQPAPVAQQETTNQETNNRQISDNKTPQQQTSESEEFDQVYLTQGLDAYYQGDYDTAAALLQPLADKGISRAQFRIGYMHYLGRGFSKNTTEADQILRAALPAIQKFANEGRSWAQSDLGSLYEDGLVLARNYNEAIYWYRSAAEQGYPGAQTNLGIMYARGRGVTTSRQTAIQWFQRAAKQGDIAAQRNLESLGVN